jgi:hypothetical protein
MPQVKADNFEEFYNYVSQEELIKILCNIDEDEELDEEEHFFEIGLVRMHGLLEDDSLTLTPSGKKAVADVILYCHDPDNE